MAHLFELSTLLAENKLLSAAEAIRDIAQADAACLFLSDDLFSNTLEEPDRLFLAEGTLPKPGSHAKLRSRVANSIFSVGRTEIDAFKPHDLELIRRIEQYLRIERERQPAFKAFALDAETGFWSRELFFEFMQQEVVRATRHRFPLSLILIDIDGFSSMPQPLVVLSKVAERLRQEVRQGDIVGRVFENTFAILEPFTNAQQAAESAGRFLKKFKHLPVLVNKTPVQIGLSIGVATLATNEDAALGLFARADLGLSAAKRTGGGAVVFNDL